MLLFNHMGMNLFFRKAIFLCLCVMPFCIVSEHGFAATGYEKCKEDIPNVAVQCHEFRSLLNLL
jgi:hypothetical protein